MPEVIDRLAAAEGTAIFGEIPAISADCDEIGTGLDLDRTIDRTGSH